MSNNRANVEALAALIERHGIWPDHVCRVLAERLSGEGVLVPSVLTDEQAMAIGCHDKEDCRCDPSDIRAELERIAKGEE